ncbi:putative transcription factor bZIP family [Helianthus annuus]|nr:putative transcription factor bZIP family [Helianthus annuus]
MTYYLYTLIRGKRLGIPPAHPQIPGTWSPRSNQQTSSQPLFFSVDSLPPLSPSSYRGPTSDQIVGDVTHRRSNSDIPFGFSTILQSSPPLIPLRGSKGFDVSAHLRNNIKQESNWEKTCSESNAEGLGERKSEGEVVDDRFSSYVNLNNLGKLNSFRTENGEDLDSRASGTKANGGDSSDNEATSSVIGSNNNMQRSDTFSLDFGNGVFNGAELKKIMANENLAEMALTDPKRVKRILANRQSAARSKERKMRYIAELENKVQNLQTEATTLSAQVTLLQRDLTSLTSQNNELKFRVQAMEQQSHLRDALNDTLTAEVQRLKIMRLELSADATNFSQPSINLQMFQLHHQHEQQEQNGGTTTHD